MTEVSGVPQACCWCQAGPLEVIWERFERPEWIVVGKALCWQCQQTCLYSRRLTFYERTRLRRDDGWEHATAEWAPDMR